jgi:hypothetical protein
MWQDRFNLLKKGMTPVDMRLLLLSHEEIERVCTQERFNAQVSKKPSTKAKKSNKRSGTEVNAKVPKKACTKKHCSLSQKHGGVYTRHNTSESCRFKKDGKEKANFLSRKNAGKKHSPVKQSFAQLCEKTDKLMKAIKKDAKKKKCHCSDSNSNTE